MHHHQFTLPGPYDTLSGVFDIETGVMLCPLSCYLILSGAHYRLVLIFHVYLVLPAFTAYQTLTRDYRDLDT